MSQLERWPTKENATTELEHKLGECIWWLIVLADRMNIDINVALEKFFTKPKKIVGKCLIRPW
jgi:NTP pyrophosphatase (non-canonical NTP hydrolase)